MQMHAAGQRDVHPKLRQSINTPKLPAARERSARKKGDKQSVLTTKNYSNSDTATCGFQI
jgi:hypothetical protein